MTTYNEKALWNARKYVAEATGTTLSNLGYMNTVIADALAEGHKAEMNSDWLRRFLLQNVEFGFIKYEEALALNKVYTKVIANYR